MPRELRRFEVAQPFVISSFEFRHCFVANHIFLFDRAAVNRLAVAFFQPINQGFARAFTAVITIARRHFGLFDFFNQRLVIIERAFDEKEAFARQLFGHLTRFEFHFQADDAAGGLRKLGMSY